MVGLVEELGLDRPVLAGYDIGSRIAQAVARTRPDLVHALVVAPPLPGIGDRILDPAAQREFWYQSFHRLPVDPAARRSTRTPSAAYLRHFWSHWSGPGCPLTDDDLDPLVSVYDPPGPSPPRSPGTAPAPARSPLPRRANPRPDEQIRCPTTVLWPAHDPLFPRAWGDRLDDFFTDVTVTDLPDSGHFVPLEAPEDLAAAVLAALGPAQS